MWLKMVSHLSINVTACRYEWLAIAIFQAPIPLSDPPAKSVTVCMQQTPPNPTSSQPQEGGPTSSRKLGVYQTHLCLCKKQRLEKSNVITSLDISVSFLANLLQLNKVNNSSSPAKSNMEKLE